MIKISHAAASRFQRRLPPGRYLALRAFGSKKYQRVGKKYQPSLDREKGRSQLEYADEVPIVRDWFHEASATRGANSQMAKHYEKKL
jgi:hypothetical protein